MEKRSLARRQPGRGIPMTAVPRTAAIRASAGRRFQQPLPGSQSEHAWQHPPTAVAGAARSSAFMIREATTTSAMVHKMPRLKPGEPVYDLMADLEQAPAKV